MEILVILLFFVCAQVSAQGNADKLNTVAFQQACPYTDFCHKNASREIQDDHRSPCCTGCSCADECWERGNCCPDKIVENQGSLHELETCTDTVVKNLKYGLFFSNGLDKYRRRYFVTKRCPDTINDESVKGKCDGTLADVFSDLVWVTDTNTNKIYNNRYCAQCHGVRKYKQWNLETSCLHFLTNSNYSQKLSSFPDVCSLTTTPPNRKAYQNLCISPDISTCNETGLWETDDTVTEELCESHPLLFIEELWGLVTTRVYRNVFCFKCNSPTGTVIQDTCPYHDVGGGKTIASFTAILNIFEEDTSFLKTRRCSADEVEDPLTRICLKLHCPVLSRPWYGSCERLSSASYLLGITVRYRLRTKWDMVHYGIKKGQDYLIADLAVEMRRQMYEDLGLQHCERCHAKIFRSNQDSPVGETILPLFFDFTAYFSTYGGNCSEVDIASAMANINGKELIVNMNENEYVTFEVNEIEYSYMPEENTSQVDIPLSEDATCLARISVRYSDISKCPIVKLSEAHYPSLMDLANTEAKKVFVNTLFAIEAGQEELEVRQNTSSVCWENYRMVFARLANTSLKHSAQNSVTMLIIFVTFTLF